MLCCCLSELAFTAGNASSGLFHHGPRCPSIPHEETASWSAQHRNGAEKGRNKTRTRGRADRAERKRTTHPPRPNNPRKTTSAGVPWITEGNASVTTHLICRLAFFLFLFFVFCLGRKLFRCVCHTRWSFRRSFSSYIRARFVCVCAPGALHPLSFV